MWVYLVRRLLASIPVLFLVTLLVFFLVRMVPGDVAEMMLGQNASPEEVEALREELGFDDPIAMQYLSWLGGIARGDLGDSVWSRKPVLDELVRRIPITMELALLSIFISTIIGIPVGILAAVKQDSPIDLVARSMAIAFLAMPSFWLAAMALTVLALWFDWIPPLRYVKFTDDPITNLQQFFLPSLLLGASASGFIMRMTRSTMLEIIRQDFVRTAYSKGLAERVVLRRHILKNALIPIVTIIGLQFGQALGGTVIIESIFALPGVGRLTVDAIFQRDYPQLQLSVAFIAAVYVLANLVVDMTYAVLDPRIRYS